MPETRGEGDREREGETEPKWCACLHFGPGKVRQTRTVDTGPTGGTIILSRPLRLAGVRGSREGKCTVLAAREKKGK